MVCPTQRNPLWIGAGQIARRSGTVIKMFKSIIATILTRPLNIFILGALERGSQQGFSNEAGIPFTVLRRVATITVINEGLSSLTK